MRRRGTPAGSCSPRREHSTRQKSSAKTWVCTPHQEILCFSCEKHIQFATTIMFSCEKNTRFRPVFDSVRISPSFAWVFYIIKGSDTVYKFTTSLSNFGTAWKWSKKLCFSQDCVVFWTTVKNWGCRHLRSRHSRSRYSCTRHTEGSFRAIIGGGGIKKKFLEF